jgi:hypothetical protein
MLVYACLRRKNRRAKNWNAKVQLAFGFIAVAALILAALTAIVGSLIAAGVVGGAAWAFGIAFITGGAALWKAIRKRLLAIAATTQQSIRYVKNEDRRRDTVAMTVDDAIDGLRDNGWKGDIHLLGYSFGSLVLFDALVPMKTSLRALDVANPLASVTTIGFPIDAVRLFRPKYLEDRKGQLRHAKWRNLFIAADVFGSNLKNTCDTDEGVDELGIPGFMRSRLDISTKSWACSGYSRSKASRHMLGIGERQRTQVASTLSLTAGSRKQTKGVADPSGPVGPAAGLWFAATPATSA